MTEILASQTPPILHGPSEKEKKYDRQLRLWAASGQAALESANILYLNLSGSGTVGYETLKNLVLPGIGRFTIADDAKVAEEDLGVNFFLDESCLGQSRAKCCMERLLELNPDVQGDYLPKQGQSLDAGTLLSSSPAYTMILHTFPLKSENLDEILKYGKQHQIPVVSIHSAGFYSYFKTNLSGAFPIVDTHPSEESMSDLRLLSPWPELAAFGHEMTRNINGLDDHEHGHLPWVVILLHFLEQWRRTHSGKNPSNYAEKVAFRKTVSEAARKNNPEGGEENFDEACAAVIKTISPISLPSELKEVFDYGQSMQNDQKSSFWLIAEALKTFYDKHQCLPLPGNVPDMKAQSNVYVKLQNIYKAKARQDVAEVLRTVQALKGGRDIDPEEVDLFCKNAAFVKLINAHGDSSESERLSSVAAAELANDANAKLIEQPLSLLPIYLALQAISFTGERNEDAILEDIRRVVPALLEADEEGRVKRIAQEVARARSGELHNISALTGGMVAQEVIKIITKQYIPVDNTCIFDGISSRCQVLRL